MIQPAPQAGDEPSLPRRFFRLTGINILANVTVPLAGLVDTAMLGHLSDIRFLAGAALAVLLFEYLYWSCGFLRMATTGSVAQARGRGDNAEGCSPRNRARAQSTRRRARRTRSVVSP